MYINVSAKAYAHGPAVAARHCTYCFRQALAAPAEDGGEYAAYSHHP